VVGALAHHEREASLSFPGDIRRVVVAVDAGSIEIHGHDGHGVAGTRHESLGLRRPVLSERVEGDTLRITGECGNLVVHWCASSYELDVPRDAALDLRSSTGHVMVDGVDGDVRARSQAGAVTVDGARGPLDLESTAGTVSGTGLGSTRVTATTSAGSVDLSFLVAPEAVTARSAAGKVVVEVPRDEAVYRVEAESSTNDPEIGVRTDSTSDRVIVASTSAGSVEVNYTGP
jgi:hypothetical protein